MVFLFAPFVVQDLPPALKDNKFGLVLVMVLSLGGLALLYASGLMPIVKGFIVWRAHWRPEKAFGNLRVKSVIESRIRSR